MSRTTTIRLALFDVDGIMTDGRLWYLPDGQEIKCFHVHDGMGIKLLQQHGIQTGIVSARGGPALQKRIEQLGIEYSYLEQRDKLTALHDVMTKCQIAPEHISFMGDDLADKAVMQAVGYAITVANAVPDIKAIADFETTRSGGQGAVREAAQHILHLNSGE